MSLVTKPYNSIWFGAIDVAKTYEFICFGAMAVNTPYEFRGFRGPQMSQTVKSKQQGPKIRRTSVEIVSNLTATRQIVAN